MTRMGFDGLDRELRQLKGVERPAVIRAIAEAREHGDLSENAEYHAAKERQGHIEAQIAEFEDKLARAVVIDPTTLSGDKVVFGATVELEDEDSGETVKYQIVGEDEAERGAQLRPHRRPRAFARLGVLGREQGVGEAFDLV